MTAYRKTQVQLMIEGLVRDGRYSEAREQVRRRLARLDETREGRERIALRQLVAAIAPHADAPVAAPRVRRDRYWTALIEQTGKLAGERGWVYRPELVTRTIRLLGDDPDLGSNRDYAWGMVNAQVREGTMREERRPDGKSWVQLTAKGHERLAGREGLARTS
jgi:Arc/MetJ-type ribon-helix-helix transcriptional regulator